MIPMQQLAAQGNALGVAQDAGADLALTAVWERYANRLLRLARGKLHAARSRAADEEDVVQSALLSYWQGLRAGRYLSPREDNDVWPLLRVITARKAVDHLRREERKKRGADLARRSSGNFASGADAQTDGIEQLPASDDLPQDKVEFSEQLQWLFDRLDDALSRNIVLRRIEGFNNREIACRCGCARSTIVRKLALIRALWTRECAGKLPANK